MKDLKKVSDFVISSLADKGIARWSVVAVNKETREFNAENGDFSLFRTLFDNNIVVTAFEGQKMGTVTGNDFSEEGLENSVRAAVLSAQSAVEDPAHDFAPDQGRQLFDQGCYDPDLKKFFSRLTELLEDVKKAYPLVKVMNLIADHVKLNSIMRNSNGTEFERLCGEYSVTLEFAGNDGTNTTGLEYCSVTTNNLDTRFIDLPEFQSHLDSAQKQLGSIPFSGKFTGPVLFTPDCFGNFLMMAIGNFAAGSAILDGTSIWLDKIGQTVASEKLSVDIKPFDERIVNGSRYTGDGFRAEDMPVIDKGVLKNFIINLYIANKTGKPVSKNGGMEVVVEGGDKSLDELVASMKQGLLVGGFSGGSPGANGEFSGVAKNSFLIEDGKITKSVTETMINGNLADVLMNIKGLSKETFKDGSSVIPYALVDNIVVSGK